MEARSPKVNTPPVADKPDQPESRGIFARIFKRREAEAKPEQKTPNPEARPSRTKLLAHAVLRIVKGDEKSPTEPVKDNPEATITPPTPEQKTPPTVSRVRKLSRAVLHFATETLGDLRQNAPTGQSKTETDRETAPLTEAAEDLSEALDDLDAAVDEQLKSSPEPETPAWDESTGGGDGHQFFNQNTAEQSGRPFAEPFEAVAAVERMQRVLEVRSHTERGKEIVGRAFAVTALGILGVGAVLIIGHRYRKSAKERRELRKQQRETEKTIRKQDRKLQRLEQSQAAEQRSINREQFIAEASQVTREQAVVTHEVAQQLRGGTQPQRQIERIQPQIPQQERSASDITIPHEAPVKTTEQPEWLRPLIRTERSEHTEQLAPQITDQSRHISAAGLSPDDTQTSDNGVQQTESQAPSSPAPAPPEPPAPTPLAGAWFYGVILIVALGVSIVIIATLFQ